MKNKPKVSLVILDGWGIAPPGPGNAVSLAKTPYIDELYKKYPHNRLYCYGEHVGLPEGQMGNSEVGHLNMGAGRVVYQDITRINIAIRENTLMGNQALRQAMIGLSEKNTLHFMGLIGPGGVHALQEHLYALIKMAAELKVPKIAIHAFLDGRDTPPDSAAGYIQELIDFLQDYPFAQIATLSGRYYAMDRDKRWERVELAWRALVDSEGIEITNPVQALQQAYKNKEFDEFIKPRVVMHDNQPVAAIGDGDSVVFYNFRADRAREITWAFIDQDFTGFKKNKKPKLKAFVAMTQYDENLDVPCAFPPIEIKQTLADVLSDIGLTQLHGAETEKYAHVTFFFNGGEEAPVPNEDRVLIPSPKDIDTYDQKPAMSAPELTDEMVKKVESGKYDFIVMNYANCDMVGHTGVLKAAIEAVETLDKCLQKLFPVILAQGGEIILTADHGNAEQMIDENTGGPYTAHTTHNQTPVLYIANDTHGYKLKEGALCDVAPTILDLLGIAKPDVMTGKSLLNKAV